MYKKFSSRAGQKLQFAIETFGLSVASLACADLGSSTGGFVDCLLQNGVSKVYSVDTAYGELAWNLRNDPRVVVLERTNALHLELPEKVDLVTVDVSWTKQEKIIPVAMGLLKKGGSIITLVKPHYELGKARMTEEDIETVLGRVRELYTKLRLRIIGEVESPIVGEKGKNKEYLFLLRE